MAAFRQLSTHIVPPPSNVREARSQHMVKSLTVNPYMSLIWSTNINFRPPHTLDFLVRRVICGGGSIGPATIFFVTDGQKRDYLNRASQRARGATKNQ